VEEVQGAQATRLIVLPFAKQAGGAAVVVEIKAVPALSLLAIMEGVPQAGEEKPQRDLTLHEVRQILETAESSYREIARIGLMAPAFSFGEPESGKALWSALPSKDQAFIARQIMEFSGLGGGSQEDAAVGTFPAGLGEGRADGGRAGDGGSAANGAGG
jgi:hypothetical protein